MPASTRAIIDRAASATERSAPRLEVARLAGFEPTASAFAGLRSIH